jgi:hypothetical protein
MSTKYVDEMQFYRRVIQKAAQIYLIMASALHLSINSLGAESIQI